MEKAIIRMHELTKVYDNNRAVDQLTLSIRQGEIFGLLGPNGAGKSTTILMLLGLVEPTKGEVNVCGFHSTTHPLEVKKRVGYLPDHLGFYEQMTGLQNLLYTAALNGLEGDKAKKRAFTLLEQVGLKDAAHKQAGKYSRGMKQRLGLADVLMKDPEVIILDEPTLGIDPEGVQEILQLIKQLNAEQQITVLLSSHHLHQVQAICDRVGIFVDGKLLASGRINELAAILFDEQPIIVQVEVERVDDSLIHDISTIENVTNINQVSNRLLEITCEQQITATIAEKIIGHGNRLHYIREKDYGLDEIYHRYFKGEVTHEII